jgi:lipopolysaccharide export system protein LptC
MSERVETAEAPFSELEALARPVGAPRRTQGPWRVRLLERLLAYLPVLLMGLLAVFTGWLVRNSPVPAEFQAAAVPPQTVDYAMTGFVLGRYGPDGVLRSRIEGDLMQHFPATDRVEVQGVRLRSVDATGRLMLGSADRAQSNADATLVRLEGSARVIREAAAGQNGNGRVEIRGETLEILVTEERVRSTQPVTVITGSGELRAGSLDYSRRDRVALLGGRVTGQLRPGPGPALP